MWITIAGAIFGLARGCDIAHAMDHGFDYSDPVVRWFNTLPRPNLPTASCCGKGDAYGADVYERQPNGNYRVTVTDGEYKQFPDGSVRPFIPNGTIIIVESKLVNPPSDGNPTGHGVIFLTIYNGDIIPWCFVLPPSSASR
jgi:hypothetical protein